MSMQAYSLMDTTAGTQQEFLRGPQRTAGARERVGAATARRQTRAAERERHRTGMVREIRDTDMAVRGAPLQATVSAPLWLVRGRQVFE